MTLDPLLIPYGVASLTPAQVSVQDGAVRCPAPYISIDPGKRDVLRLNGDQYDFPEAPDLRAMTDAHAQLDFLHDHLRHHCDLWARPPKLFLEQYFAFIAAQVTANNATLAVKLAPYGSLFAVPDWALSAPRPLPRAQIMAGETYWPVDFAFWLGDRVLAVILQGAETTTQADRVRLRALSRIEVVVIQTAELARDGVDVLCRSLPTLFQFFWEGETLPSSPFKGTSLDDIVRE